MKRTARHHRMNRSAVGACLALLCLAEIATAHAWSLTITSGTRRLFLHVGNGALSGSSGTLNGTAGTSGAINLVPKRAGDVPLNVVTAGDPAKPAILLIHGIGYLACLREPRVFDLWITKVSRCPRVRNWQRWGCNSYAP